MAKPTTPPVPADFPALLNQTQMLFVKDGGQHIVDKIYTPRPKLPSAYSRPYLRNYAFNAASCLRCLWLCWNDIPKTNPGSDYDRRHLWFGTAVHDLISGRLDLTGQVVGVEAGGTIQEFDLDYRIDIVWSEMAEEFDNKIIAVPIEVKSSGHYGFKDKKKRVPGTNNWEVYFPMAESQAKLEHYWQLQIYLWGTGAPYGYLLYMDKDKLDFACHKAFYDKRTIGLISQQFTYLADFLINDSLPGKQFDESDWNCKFCDYCDLCWPDRSDTRTREQIQQLIDERPEKTILVEI